MILGSVWVLGWPAVAHYCVLGCWVVWWVCLWVVVLGVGYHDFRGCRSFRTCPHLVSFGVCYVPPNVGC